MRPKLVTIETGPDAEEAVAFRAKVVSVEAQFATTLDDDGVYRRFRLSDGYEAGTIRGGSRSGWRLRESDRARLAKEAG